MNIQRKQCIQLLTLHMALSGSLVAITVSAESGHHGAHVHGVAELQLALENQDLEISFTSPAMSVLGFEHKATNAAQRAAVGEARNRLRDAASLFKFTGTTCELHSTTIDIPSATESESGHHSKHEQHASHKEESSHSDVNAHYEFECADGERLKSLRIGGTELPFGLEKINAMWVMASTQGAAILTAKKQSIQFN